MAEHGQGVCAGRPTKKTRTELLVDWAVLNQAESINGLNHKLERLKNNVIEMAELLSKSTAVGKSEHPGHQFLTAREWFQFAEMPCRHRFRQKDRIVKKLRI